MIISRNLDNNKKAVFKPQKMMPVRLTWEPPKKEKQKKAKNSFISTEPTVTDLSNLFFDGVLPSKRLRIIMLRLPGREGRGQRVRTWGTQLTAIPLTSSTTARSSMIRRALFSSHFNNLQIKDALE
jgi:hypothetical protein